jgi:uroporphyrinogen-III synthase
MSILAASVTKQMVLYGQTLINIMNMAKQPTVISTWPEKPDDRFKTILESQDITVLSMPLIEIDTSFFELKQNINDYQWIIFTSKNGVRSFLKKYKPSPVNQIAVIGAGTASALLEEGYEPDFTGSGHSGEKFAEELQSVLGIGKNILLVLGSLAPDLLTKSLNDNNQVERVNVYETKQPENINERILSRIKNDDYDLIAVSSPSGIKNLYHLVSDNPRVSLRVVSIGETTTSAALGLGIKVKATAKNQSYEGLAKTVLEVLNRTG